VTTFPPDPKCPAPPGVTLTLAQAEALTDLATVVAPMRPAAMTPREWQEWNRILGLIEDAVRVAKGGAA
jgi:hypothetical protein